MWAMHTPYKLQLHLDQFCLVTTLGALHFFKKNPPAEMSGYGPAFPLPRIDDSLDLLANTAYFTTLDLFSGYWQVEMDSKSREKTAFCSHSGLYKFNVISFGLCNAPATFQRLMEAVLVGLAREKCIVYLDDILVIGKTFQEHLENLAQVYRGSDKQA